MGYSRKFEPATASSHCSSRRNYHTPAHDHAPSDGHLVPGPAFPPYRPIDPCGRRERPADRPTPPHVQVPDLWRPPISPDGRMHRLHTVRPRSGSRVRGVRDGAAKRGRGGPTPPANGGGCPFRIVGRAIATEAKNGIPAAVTGAVATIPVLPSINGLSISSTAVNAVSSLLWTR
jgi:hypothetical protein